LNGASFAATKNNTMGLFDKGEKKLRKELGKKNSAFCRETVKELEELHTELKTAYDAIDDVVAEFTVFKEGIAKSLSEEENTKMDYFLKRFKKIDKVARDDVRDIRDLLRSQKKRLSESEHDE